MPDFLEKQRRELEQRRDELKPLLEESERLQAALSALAGIPGSTQTATASPAVPAPAKATTDRRRKPGRPRKSAASPASATPVAAPPSPASKPARKTRAKNPRGGRPKGSGKRAGEALALIQKQPGITIPELGAKMGIKQNYLYRVMPGLEAEGKISKQGRGFHPVGS
jgi:hypothetical protein